MCAKLYLLFKASLLCLGVFGKTPVSCSHSPSSLINDLVYTIFIWPLVASQNMFSFPVSFWGPGSEAISLGLAVRLYHLAWECDYISWTGNVTISVGLEM